MIKKVGGESIITSDPQVVYDAKKLILPGVGSFDNGVKRLRELGLWDALKIKVENENVPILGICLGAQLMTKGSEEGIEKGFNWVDADTIKFRIAKNPKFKVPNMGWRTVTPQKSSKLFDEMWIDSRFYFVHSYHFSFNNKDQILSHSEYSYEFASSFENKNILGVQFHPEKSHKFGTRLLKNFIEKY